MFPVRKAQLAAIAFLTSLTLAAALHSAPAFAQDVTVHQVYEAVQAGRLEQAETMMVQVLRDHPNSAKAHYVAAEVYAKEGRLGTARGELTRAEQLDPSLSFAKPEAVRALRAAIDGGSAGASGSRIERGALQARDAAATSERGGFPWGWILVLGAVVIGGVMLLNARRRAAASSSYGMSPQQGGYPAPGAATPYPGSPMPMNPSAPSGGMGSGLVGALATGAAVGAGVVAGEAIAHRLMGDHGRDGNPSGSPAPLADAGAGQGLQQVDPDFGVQDGGGWDHAGSADNGDFGGDLGGDLGGDDWS